MKKQVKVLTAIITSAVCAFGIAALSGCAQKQTLTGEMSYNRWGVNYGIRVNVEVQTDSKGDRISKVTVADSDFVSASESDGWDKTKWDSNLNNLLLAYRGEYVADVLAKEVATDGEEPLAADAEGFVNYGDDFISSGATVGSGRLLLAVQNALKTLEGYCVAEGEYGYSSWGTDFGAKVRVVVKDGVIQKVAVLSSDLVNASEVDGWNKDLWYDNLEAILKSYEGKSVEAVKNGTAQVSGQDGATTNSVSDSDLIVTGATLSSARLFKAVQNALADL